MKKRIFSLLLAAAMMLGSAPAAVAAEDFSFTDVPEQYAGAVSWVYSQGYMVGTAPGRFEPFSGLTRAQMAVILWRLAGTPSSDAPLPFRDVPAGAWYEEAVRWANASGNMVGLGGGTFGPSGLLSRQDLALVLYRYAALCGYVMQTGTLEGFPDSGAVSGYAAEAVAWAMASGVLSPDGGGSIRPAAAAVRAEAAAALLALAAPANSSLPASAAAEYEAMAAARREAILSSETKIVHSDVFIPGETYTGRAYYVSSSEGNDNNNGLSPESPWQSVWQVINIDLQAGDAVFFKRGDMWRQELFETVPGVTYSAYGEGPKPILSNSPEDGADPAKWTLYYQGSDGRKIWKFHEDLDTVGGIYLNGTDQEASRVYGYWTGDHYVDLEYSYDPAPDPENASGWTLRVGGEQRPETSLDDLEFCCMPDLTGRTYPIDLLGDKSPGPLYLRCDAGNPGEVFDSIEFCGSYWPIKVSTDCVFDNLSVRYWSVFAFWGHPDTDRNVVIQNCEIAYGRQNAVIRDNYLHDNDGSGITFETGSDSRPQGGEDGPLTGLTFTCTGNLLERCGACIQLNDGNDWFSFDKITVSGNIAADAGYNYGTKTMGVNSFCPFADLILGAWGKLSAKTLEVSGNLFLRSRRYILTLGWDSVYDTENEVSFHDNVYVQDVNGLFGPNSYGDWFVCTASDPLLRLRLWEYTHGENETVLTLTPSPTT